MDNEELGPLEDHFILLGAQAKDARDEIERLKAVHQKFAKIIDFTDEHSFKLDLKHLTSLVKAYENNNPDYRRVRAEFLATMRHLGETL